MLEDVLLILTNGTVFNYTIGKLQYMLYEMARPEFLYIKSTLRVKLPHLASRIWRERPIPLT